jgi:hypothetical protein
MIDIAILSIFTVKPGEERALMHQTVGKYIMIAGILLILAGIILYFSGGKFKWFGNLPGDIRIVRDNFRLYVPVTTMILMSVVLTLIINLIRRLF